MKDKKNVNKGRTGLTRRQLFGAAGTAVASVAVAGAGGFIGGRASLEGKIRDLEWDRRYAESINALYSFLNPLYTEEFTSDEAFRHLRESLVVIESEKKIMGTGVLIGDYVLSAHHVIKPMTKEGKEQSDIGKGEVVRHGDNSYGFHFVHHDEEADLALLRVYSNGFFMPPKISRTSHELKVGRDIRVLGMQEDRTIYNQKGKITAVNHPYQERSTGRVYQNRFITDTYAEHGMSGGILADPNGSFLGIVLAKSFPKEYAIGVGMDVIIPFLANAAAKESKTVLQYKRV